MFDLFPDGPVHEYPQLINVVYSFVWAFLLAAIIAITHKVTYVGSSYPKNFFQSLILGAIVTTMIMLAIGDSLARGLGVFGAMAIIRFRTRIDDPRDVLFLFAALSTGLAIGVYGLTISFAGTALFCLAGLILHNSPFRSATCKHDLQFGLDDTTMLAPVLETIKRHTFSAEQIVLQPGKDKLTRYVYRIALHDNDSLNRLAIDLTNISGIHQIKISKIESIG